MRYLVAGIIVTALLVYLAGSFVDVSRIQVNDTINRIHDSSERMLTY